MSIKRAVCVVIPRMRELGLPLFLGVTRKNDSTKVGLPGGKVDPGESESLAVLRETLEETGFYMLPEDLVPLYSAYCPGEVGYWVTTYLYVGGTHGVVMQMEQGVVPAYCTRETLCDEKYSPFAKYNDGVFGAYDNYMKACNAT